MDVDVKVCVDVSVDVDVCVDVGVDVGVGACVDVCVDVNVGMCAGVTFASPVHLWLKKDIFHLDAVSEPTRDVGVIWSRIVNLEMRHKPDAL